MADWTDIPDENLAPGAPGRSADIIALRDNVTALAEGATDAPEIQTAAIADEAVTADKLAPDAARLNNAETLNNEVGSYAMLLNLSASARTAGQTLTGSNLRYTNASGALSGTPSGTWRCMGYSDGYDSTNREESVTLWLRIS